jgi:tripartite-type tricarboxylate transporter receptor subunit TctC
MIGGIALSASRPGAAQGFPSKPIRLVVPLPPGGATDFIARALGQRVGAALGQPVIIENKPGANQAIGVMDVVRAAPDGHSLLLGQSSILLNPLVASNVQYDVMRDLAPVSLVCESYAYFVVPASNPARNFQEFVSWAKSQPPGLAFGSTGAGSSTHIYGVMINQRSGLDMTHVPYRGEAPVVPDLVSGRIQSGFLSGLTALQLAKEGKLKIIASIGSARSPSSPNIPTLGEAGMVDVPGWYGVFAPRATPLPIINALSAEFDKAIQHPDIKDKMATSSLGPRGGSPKDFQIAIGQTLEGWTRVVKETGVRAD